MVSFKPQNPRIFRYQAAYHRYYRNSWVSGWTVQDKKHRIQLEWFNRKHINVFSAEDRFLNLFNLSKLTSMKHVSLIPRKVFVKTKKSLCIESRRARGFNRFTGLSRFRLKEFVERGILPGMYRASW